MPDIHQKIVNAYVRQKLSVRQIMEKFGISQFKVIYTLDKHNVKRRSISDAIRFLNITKFSKKEFNLSKRLNIKEEMLRVAGMMLYWGEGTKEGGTVALSNSNPDIIRLFLKFLRKICGVHEKRLRVLLHYYPDQNERLLKRYWQSITRIPESQFCKSFLHRRISGNYKRTSKLGTISLRYSDKKLLDTIIHWIKEYSRKL